MRLLCVEDEASLRDDIVEFLRMRSYDVDEAASGEQAIEQLNKNHYDLVLCDIKMPKMDGHELLKLVRKENELTSTPFIFLSALSDNESRIRAHEAGCDGYLTKPIDFSVLEATLKSYIERQRVRDFLYMSTLEVTRRQVMAAIDQSLDGPISESMQIIRHLRETLPVLTPGELDENLARLEEHFGEHATEMHAIHGALQLQVSDAGLRIEDAALDDLIRESVSECHYYYPTSKVTYEQPKKTALRRVKVDSRLMQRAIAGLLAVIPHPRTSRDVVTVETGEGFWSLTITDHVAMVEDGNFKPVDETTNLSVLSNVTRQRLVPLAFATQVAHVHGGRLEVKVWPGDHLAVRFIIPQENVHVMPLTAAVG